MLRKFGLQRVALERIFFPEILLAEADDVILLEAAVEVECFVLGDQVAVGAFGDVPTTPRT